ncbi:head GIN domain-containing protein [Massilia sp. TS11]|uniref:head GIN domain-containing protein n=1 Tax=Massilia sp. TS11 TaxID=2908003 RepID=UPI001EDBAA48|nr:head GIN domain-containing protein [Massilia sp. TS11]MCG2583223.1 DUF2807 domain-containing protein [Massilia sp. TS11]
MWKAWQTGVVAIALCAAAGSVQARDEHLTETRPIDARVVRVKLDGPVDLKLRQGDTPSLVISGERKYVEKTTTTQHGDTLNIDMESHTNFKFGKLNPLRIELTLPRLRELRTESLGATEVTGFSGEDIELALEGAGSLKVQCNYKTVNASLGGLGSLNISGLNSDAVNLDLQGAGYVTLSGQTKQLKASLGGLGGLDAKSFYADTVNLDLSGLGNASVHARQNANLNLSGLGSVTVYGKPQNKHVSVDGLGKVSWK